MSFLVVCSHTGDDSCDFFLIIIRVETSVTLLVLTLVPCNCSMYCYRIPYSSYFEKCFTSEHMATRKLFSPKGPFNIPYVANSTSLVLVRPFCSSNTSRPSSHVGSLLIELRCCCPSLFLRETNSARVQAFL